MMPEHAMKYTVLECFLYGYGYFIYVDLCIIIKQIHLFKD